MSLLEARDMLSVQADGSPITDKSYVSQLVTKWGPLIEGLESELPAFTPRGQGDFVKAITAFMMESQMKHLRTLNEDTRSFNVGPFMKFVFPVIRRAAVRLVATSIASVQPMTGPVGGVAFYRPRYTDNKGQVVAGSEINKTFNKWYSSDFIDGEQFATGDGVVTTFGPSLAKWLPVKGLTFSIRSGSPTGAALASDDGNGNIVAAGGGNIGTINYNSGEFSFTLGTAPLAGVGLFAVYRYNNEANSRIPQVQLDLELKEIRAESRKLKSLTSVEAADDLKALWGRNIDADLVATMADELTAGIDREILGTAFNAVEPEARVKWDRMTPSGVSDPDHLKSLVIQMSRASQFIHRRTQQGAANWAVTSSEFAALLNTMDGFQAVDEGHVYQGGIVRGGVLNRQWVIYIDPQFPSDKILMGHQGSSILDTGIIYSPYIPMEITPPFVDPNDFTIRRAVRTRHKVTLVRPEFFSLVDANNMTN